MLRYMLPPVGALQDSAFLRKKKHHGSCGSVMSEGAQSLRQYYFYIGSLPLQLIQLAAADLPVGD